jgi:hypothetical protein
MPNEFFSRNFSKGKIRGSGKFPQGLNANEAPLPGSPWRGETIRLESFDSEIQWFSLIGGIPTTFWGRIQRLSPWIPSGACVQAPWTAMASIPNFTHPRIFKRRTTRLDGADSF